MFEGDLTELSTADLLESAAEHRAEANRLDARLLQHAVEYADRFRPDAVPVRPGSGSCDGRERAVVLGGEGCPEIAEFAVGEFGVVLGISPGVARDFLGQALALRHRFPFTWARILSGEATPWKARQLATACLKLSEDAARSVDRRVAPLIDTITPYRLDKIIRAAKIHAAPGVAQQEADQKADERGVFVSRDDDHGTTTMFVRAPSGAVKRHYAALTSIANALQTFGDTRSLNARRSTAVGIIADPLFTHELLTQARHHSATTAGPNDIPEVEDEAGRDGSHPRSSDSPHPLDAPSTVPVERRDPTSRGSGHDPDDGEPLDAAARRALHARLAHIKRDAYASPSAGAGRRERVRPGQTEIYVHLTDHTLATGTGVVRAEGIGPLLASQVAELIGYGPYTVKPVIDLNEAVSVDAYEIPDTMRERVRLIHPVEQFPYGTRETTTSMDLDHIEPYDSKGPPGQTGTTNLAPLSRFGHRLKTHASGWDVHRLDRITLEWSTPNGFVFHVDPNGTRRVREKLNPE